MSDTNMGMLPVTPRLAFNAPNQSTPDTEQISEPTETIAIDEPVAELDEVEEAAVPFHDDPPNLDDMSVEELKRQQEEIQRRLLEKQKAEKRSVIDQIVDVVSTYQITTEELVEALGGFKPKRQGVKAKAKYRDPISGITWSGRGKEPVWLRGKDRNKFLIQNNE